MTFAAASCIPKPIAGGPDVTTTIHNTSTGLRGKTESLSWSLKASPTMSTMAWPTFPASRWSANDLMLSNERRPSRMAAIMEAKLSSVSTMSARICQKQNKT